MRRKYTPLKRYDIEFATQRAKMYAGELIEAVQNFQADSERKQRLAEAVECKACYYLHRSRWGGASITRWHCGVCATEGIHGSTAVPCVCKSCAKEHELCSNCGGDLHMRVRRRTFPTPAPSPAPVGE